MKAPEGILTGGERENDTFGYKMPIKEILLPTDLSKVVCADLRKQSDHCFLANVTPLRAAVFRAGRT